MQVDPTHPRRTTPELMAAFIAVAVESRAVTIANDVRNARSPYELSLLYACLRLRHHLHEMTRALDRSRQQARARHKALVLTRSALEARLDRAARAPDPVRQQLVERFALARTKFVMSTKADALSELALRVSRSDPGWMRMDSAMDTAEIARTHLATLWTRIVESVHAPVSSFAKRLCSEIEGSLLELGEGLLADALVDILPVPLGTFDDEMGGRLRLLRGDLGRVLGLGAEAITQRLLDYYDHAMCSLDARVRQRLDSIEASILTAGQFADEAMRASERTVIAQQSLLQWSAQLAQIIDEIR